MPRIYFDTNVFSNLKSAKDIKFQELALLMQQYQHRLSFYFSYAHIRDKYKDLTDYKFRDFEFMETIVSDNYLAYDPIDKKVSFYLATPSMVYTDQPTDPMVGLMNFFDPADDDDDSIKAYKILVKALTSEIPLPPSAMTYDLLPEDQQKVVAEILPLHNDDASYFDAIQNLSNFTRKLFENSDLYKNLRNMIYEGFNKGKLKLNEELDFNELLKDTAIQQTFLDFVRGNMHFKDKDHIPYHDFYQSAYSMLDAFGIDKDEITAKNTLTNLNIDAMHSFFAQYCDYLVTDDKTITRKSRALYKMFKQETKVVSVEEFKKLFHELLGAPDDEDDLNWFLQKLTYDLTHADRHEPFVTGKNSYSRLTFNHRYLDFFDGVLELTSASVRQIIIFKTWSHELSDPSFSERARIIAKALQVFGPDLNGMGEFNYQNQPEKYPALMERTWHIDGVVFELRHLDDLDKYTLIITLPEILDN